MIKKELWEIPVRFVFKIQFLQCLFLFFRGNETGEEYEYEEDDSNETEEDEDNYVDNLGF